MHKNIHNWTKCRQKHALYANISPWSGMIWVSLSSCSCSTLLAAWRTSRSTTGGNCCCLIAGTFVEGFWRVPNETKDMGMFCLTAIVLKLGGARNVTDAFKSTPSHPRDDPHHIRCHWQRNKGRRGPRRVKLSPSRARRNSLQNSSSMLLIRTPHPTSPLITCHSITSAQNTLSTGRIPFG